MNNISLLNKNEIKTNPYFGNQLSDLENIEYFFSNWTKFVTEKNIDKVLDLYSEQAILHPTFSTIMHTTNEERRIYFLNLFLSDGLSVFVESYNIRIYENVAVNSGFYTFKYLENNIPKESQARFSFVYVKKNNQWSIIEHHSSKLI